MLENIIKWFDFNKSRVTINISYDVFSKHHFFLRFNRFCIIRYKYYLILLAIHAGI